ncbi:MAG: exodeoxyribonuclease VII large subunit [Phycisphaeraceae bacterium]
MARLPFDSNGSADPTARPAVGNVARSDTPLTVSQVAALVRGVLAEALPAKLRIIGEVSNFTARTHWFFSLKDEQATLRCVCFASSAGRVGFRLADGIEVVATGRIDYYDAQGQLQLYVEKLEPVGQGALELRFRQLCDELRQLGYFDVERKKPLPTMPQRVAVVTSRTGAALQDVIHTAARRWAGCQLLLYDVHVQGAAAAPEIAAAIDTLSQQGKPLGIDAVILTRGGGSIEDLWAFNERVVADALFRCPLPVAAAIGHETDTTVAELVADMRCATPTQAAMTLIPDREALEHQLRQLSHRLVLLMRRRVDASRQRVDSAARHPLLQRPDRMLAPLRDRLTTLSRLLTTGALRKLQSSQQQVEALTRQLGALGPRNVLQRGYSYTLRPNGRVLRQPQQVQPGDRITTVLAAGRLTSRVETNGQANATSPRRRGKRKADDDTQRELFT